VSVLALCSGISILGTQAVYDPDSDQIASVWMWRGLLCVSWIGVLSCIAIYHAGWAAHALGSGETVTEMATLYGQYVALAVPAQIINQCLWNFSVSANRSATVQLVANSIGFFASIYFNFEFIYRDALALVDGGITGFAGAPMATAAVSWLRLAVTLIYFSMCCCCEANPQEGQDCNFWSRLFSGFNCGQVLSVRELCVFYRTSLPSFISVILQSSVIVVLLVFANSTPNREDNISALVIINTLYQIPYTMLTGCGLGCGARLGVAIGQCDVNFCKRVVRVSLFTAVVLGLPFIILFTLLRHQVAAPFCMLSQSDPAHFVDKVTSTLGLGTVRMGTSEKTVADYLPYLGLITFANSFTNPICYGIFQSQHRSHYTFLLRVLMVVLFVLLAYVLVIVHKKEMIGLMEAWAASALITATVTVAVAFNYDWEEAFEIAREEYETEQRLALLSNKSMSSILTDEANSVVATASGVYQSSSAAANEITQAFVNEAHRITEAAAQGADDLVQEALPVYRTRLGVVQKNKLLSQHMVPEM